MSKPLPAGLNLVDEIIYMAGQVDALSKSQAIASFGLDGMVLSANQNFLDIFGYTMAEVEGRHHRMFVAPAYASGAEYLHFWSVLHNGQFQAAEYMRIGKDGREVWLQACYNPILGFDGRPLKVMKFATDISARKRAEMQLAARQTKCLALRDPPAATKLRLFEGILASTRDTVLITEAEPVGLPGPHILYANPALTEMTGHGVAEVIGNTPRMFQGVLTDTETNGKIRAALKVWKPFREAVLNDRKDGAIFWAALSLAPVCDEKGHDAHWVSVQRDITSRKREEDKLRKSENFLARTASLAGIGGWEIEVTTGALFFSAETYRIYGLDTGAALSVETALSFFAPEGRDRLVAALAACGAQGVPYDMEIPFIRANGERIWTRAIGSAELADGKPVRVSGLFQDIDEQVKERHALQQASDTLNLAKEAGRIGIWTWEFATDEIVCDATVHRLYGVPESDCADFLQIWLTRLHEEDRDRVALALRETAAGQADFNTQFRIRQPGGALRHIRASGAVSRDPAGKALRMTGAMQDITALKETEAALAATARELERSNEELNLFASIASHDLQEPLRMVASYTQLLGKRYKGRLDADADDFIGYAVEGAQRMQRLIQDLLAYSRVGTKGMELRRTAAETALEGALWNLQDAIEESGAVVTHGDLPSVLADESQLTQLFQNLVGNAIKYRRAENPLIQVSADRLAGGRWRFVVRDNGLGIEAQHFERIFGMFQRLHGVGEYSGTGIGLAICKKIVDRHGGVIGVESKTDEGSAFHFTLDAE